MQYKTLGKTNTSIPAIGQGSMGIGGFFTKDSSNDDFFVDLLKKAIDLGLTLIDTAEAYGEGHSEVLIGRAIKGCRKDVFISTKVSPEHLAYDDVIKAAEDSLKRLETDYIDLYQIHWPNPTISLEDALAAMKKLVNDGKVRYVGVSNFSVEELKLANKIFKSRIVSNQIEYNLFDRTIEEDILPYCEQEKITVIAYSPLDKGLIANGPEKIALLEQIAQKYNKTKAQIALRWLTSRPPVVVIPKALDISNLEDNASAADFDMEKKDVELIDRTCKQPCISIPMEKIKVDRENLDKFSPNPKDLAESIKKGATLKPIRVKEIQNTLSKHNYELVEGKIRYWAWFFAYQGKVPIRALVRY